MHEQASPKPSAKSRNRSGQSCDFGFSVHKFGERTFSQCVHADSQKDLVGVGSECHPAVIGCDFVKDTGGYDATNTHKTEIVISLVNLRGGGGNWHSWCFVSDNLNFVRYEPSRLVVVHNDHFASCSDDIPCAQTRWNDTFREDMRSIAPI